MKLKERFPAMHYLFACYFHQDWTHESGDLQGVIANFLKLETPETVQRTATQLGQFLALDLEEEPVRLALMEAGNYYYPGPEQSYRDWLRELHGLLREAVAKVRAR